MSETTAEALRRWAGDAEALDTVEFGIMGELMRNAADELDGYASKLHECEAWLARRNEEINERDIRLATAESRLADWHKVADDRAAEIIRLSGKLERVSKLLDDWADAEKQGLGVPILAGIGQIREALK